MSAAAISPASSLQSKRRSGRCQKRVKMVAPVRLMLDAPSQPQWAHTLDVTPGGTRISGFQSDLKSGTVVEVQRLHKKAKFVVVWTQRLDQKSKEVQVGLKCLEPERHIWGVDIPAEPDSFQPKGE